MVETDLVKAEKILSASGWLYGVKHCKADAIVIVIAHNRRVQFETAQLAELRRWLSRRREADNRIFLQKAKKGVAE